MTFSFGKPLFTSAQQAKFWGVSETGWVTFLDIVTDSEKVNEYIKSTDLGFPIIYTGEDNYVTEEVGSLLEIHAYYDVDYPKRRIDTIKRRMKDDHWWRGYNCVGRMRKYTAKTFPKQNPEEQSPEEQSPEERERNIRDHCHATFLKDWKCSNAKLREIADLLADEVMRADLCMEKLKHLRTRALWAAVLWRLELHEAEIDGVMHALGPQ